MGIFDRFKKDETLLSPGEDQVLIDIKDTLGDKVNKETILKAVSILEQYRSGKVNLEKRIIANEEWWKGRHWEEIHKKDGTKHEKIEPHSAWLFNCIMSKYADYIDAYPEPNILPRELQDEEEAKRLSEIIPVVLDQSGFEKIYSNEAWYKLKAGAGIYGIFWDSNKYNGLGDITISNIDILNLFWQPGITNLQDSENIFHVNLVNNDILEQRYPELKGQLKGNGLITARYLYDDNVDTSNQSAVVDWYYHTEKDGKKILQYCKFVNDFILYATENDIEREVEQVEQPTTDFDGNEVLDEYGEPITEVVDKEVEGTSMAEKGWYEHGLYPFVVDNMFPVEGTICGFSYIDICKSPQEDIDKIKQALLKNTLAGAIPRFLSRIDGQINEGEFLDLDKPLIHYEGVLEDNLIPVQTNQLNGNYMNMLEMEIREMRETTGNTDVSQGIPTGVTSGSAISALQEAAGKTSRSQNKNAYMAYKEICLMIIELIRQFYDVPRQFRITGESGDTEFVDYSNENIKTQEDTNIIGDTMYRLPVFDIKVVPQKQNPYSKNGQNETAMTLYNMGVFNPEMGDQALALVECMDFNEKNVVIDKIKQNQMMLQQIQALQEQVMQLSQVIDAQNGTTLAEDNAVLQAAGQDGEPQPNVSGNPSVDLQQGYDHPFNARAREQAAESTQPQ